VVALIVSITLFLWPLVLRLLATWRYVAFGYAVLTGLLLNIDPWTHPGWHEVHRYDDLVRALAKDHEARGYNPIALALKSGADP
jgi:hypothetical protein